MPDQDHKLVKVDGLGIVAFPSAVPDDKILAVLRKHKGKTTTPKPTFQGLTTEQSEHARQIGNVPTINGPDWDTIRQGVYKATEPTVTPTPSGSLSAGQAAQDVAIQSGDFTNNVLKRAARTLFGVADFFPQTTGILKNLFSPDQKISAQAESDLLSLHPGAQISDRAKEAITNWRRDPKLAMANIGGDALGIYLAGKIGEKVPVQKAVGAAYDAIKSPLAQALLKSEAGELTLPSGAAGQPVYAQHVLDEVTAHTQLMDNLRSQVGHSTPEQIKALRDAVEETGRRAAEAGDQAKATKAAHTDIGLGKLLDDAIRQTQGKAASQVPVDPAWVQRMVPALLGATQKPASLKELKRQAEALKPPPNNLQYKAADESKPFYLKSEKILSEKMQGPMPAADLQKMLLSNGVKPEEMKWTGLDDFLWKNFDKKITPEQIKDFIAKNDVQIQEVQKGTGAPPGPDAYSAIEKWGESQGYGNDVRDALTYVRRGDAREGAGNLEMLGAPDNLLEPFRNYAQGEGGAKYGSWQMPGGENYRELLMTLPTKEAVERPFEVKYDPDARANESWVILKNGMRQGYASNSTDANAMADHLFGEGWRQKNPVQPETFRSSHWDEPNVVGHVRFNDRTGPNGEKLLHIEELQSDWHQKGRTHRYVDPKKPWSATGMSGQFATRKEAEDAAKANSVPLIFVRDERQDRPEGAVPDAPFKKTWHELLLKRMVRYAAEHGYDGVSWTPGEQQAERYDLSKQIRDIEYEPINDPPGTYEVIARDHDGRVVLHEDEIPLERVEELLGKDIAKKIEGKEGEDNSTAYRDWRKLSGLDLKVGGEGMHGFYDKIVPDYLNKLGKQWGAKVGETHFVTETKPKKTYVGPSYTAEELAKIAADLKGTMTEGSAKWVADSVKNGSSLEEAMDAYGSPMFAEQLGGSIDVISKKETVAVPYLPITPEMRGSGPMSLFNLGSPESGRTGPSIPPSNRVRSNILAKEMHPEAADIRAKQEKEQAEFMWLDVEERKADQQLAAFRAKYKEMLDQPLPKLASGDRNWEDFWAKRQADRQALGKEEWEVIRWKGALAGRRAEMKMKRIFDDKSTPEVGQVRLGRDGKASVFMNARAMHMLKEAIKPFRLNHVLYGASIPLSDLPILKTRLNMFYRGHEPILPGVVRLLDSAEELARKTPEGMRAGIVVTGSSGVGIQKTISTLREELLHRWQRIRSDNGMTSAHLPRHAFDELYLAIPKAAQDYLMTSGYSDTPEQRVIETSAKIMAGKVKELGITADEATAFLERYFEAVEKEHGPEAIKELEHTRGVASKIRDEFIRRANEQPDTTTESDQGIRARREAGFKRFLGQFLPSVEGGETQGSSNQGQSRFGGTQASQQSLSPSDIVKSLRDRVARTERERELFDWAHDPAVEMAESEDAADEMKDSGDSLEKYIRDDLVYRLGEQLPQMAEDQIGTATYKKDLASARMAEKLAERLQQLDLSSTRASSITDPLNDMLEEARKRNPKSIQPVQRDDRHKATNVQHEDASAVIPPEIERIRKALDVRIVKGKPYGNAVASVADHEPHTIEINDPQRFAQGPKQTLGHEIVHLWFSQLPGPLQKQVPKDDPKSPYDISKAAEWRAQGKKLWQLPQEVAATLIQRYIADPASRRNLQPWLSDLDITPLSVENPTSPSDKTINMTIRPPLPQPNGYGLQLPTMSLPALKAEAAKRNPKRSGVIVQ